MWNPSPNANKAHKVNWDLVTSHKNLGGLGIRNLVNLNLAYQLKLIWKLITKPDDL